MTKTNPATASREGLTWAKLLRFLALPFSPKKLKTFLAVKRFEEVPIEPLLGAGIKGVLIDADGTLCKHHSREFSPAVIEHVQKMLSAGLKVCIYTNAFEDRFDIFAGVEIVTDVHAKPDPRGFLSAMKNHLQLDDPAEVCMIGDNYITDGGAISAGMLFIYVQPIQGNEKWFHSLCRAYGAILAKLYFPEKFRRK
jgi:HAD superfamily phosphatase (TIGR01668 family)